MNALRKLHDALVPGGILIDTQPVSALPPVATNSHHLGPLDMRAWARTVRAIDRSIDRVVRDGLFELAETRYFGVADEFGDGEELLATVRDWDGTVVDERFARRVGGERQPVRLDQAIRLRVLRAD